MERALYIEPGEKWPGEDGGWDRLYFGSEFCPWMVPTKKEVGRALEEAGRRGWAFTLVTPYLYDEQIGPVAEILDFMGSMGTFEIVVNDYGLFTMYNGADPLFEPVLGRLLVKRMVLDRERPRDFPREYIEASNLDSPGFILFLKELGIKRVEVDHPPRGLREHGVSVAASFHYPGEFVTLTGRCPWRFDGKSWLPGGCPRPCRAGEFEMARKKDGLKVLFKGCAQFIRRSPIPDGLETSGVDRLVYHPPAGIEDK